MHNCDDIRWLPCTCPRSPCNEGNHEKCGNCKYTGYELYSLFRNCNCLERNWHNGDGEWDCDYPVCGVCTLKVTPLRVVVHDDECSDCDGKIWVPVDDLESWMNALEIRYKNVFFDHSPFLRPYYKAIITPRLTKSEGLGKTRVLALKEAFCKNLGLHPDEE